MDVAFVVKIAAIGLIVAVINQILARSGRDDYALLTALAGIIAALLMLIPKIYELYSSATSIFNL